MGRTIWVGDVHGCARELSGLIDKLQITGEDQLVFVGDLVARGPDTPGVLSLARGLGARSVRGNHEQRLLAARAAVREKKRPPRLSPSHQNLLETLTEEEWFFLEGLPLSLEFPGHNIRVVHAGVLPGLAFAAQKPDTLLNIRSITPAGEASERYSKQSWAASYREDPHVVFGHNAQGGLQLHASATGLDTGCVYGGQLSALVLPFGAQPPEPRLRVDAIVSVSSTRRHVDFGPRPD